MRNIQNNIPPERMRKSTKNKVDGVINHRFGRLIVVGHAYNKHSHIHVNCICDCGNRCIRRYDALKNGTTSSCGCSVSEGKSERQTIHGMHKSRIYCIWVGMIQRCENEKSESYPNYGGRGIKVCDRWHIFENFYNDTLVGYSDRLSLDRFPNKNGGYEPNNFRWATCKEQGRNTRSNVYLEYNGERLTHAEWAEKLGYDKRLISNRLILGWSTEKILTTPVKAKIK